MGMECEEMARDIKYNLRSQTDKLENKTMKNLFGMQRDMVKSNRLVNMIKSARLKNKLILYGIVAMLVVCVIFIFYMALAPDSVEAAPVEQSKNSEPETIDLSDMAPLEESETAGDLDLNDVPGKDD